MVLLLTGASHTGKTVLAQRLMEKYSYPYFSLDLLKNGTDPQRPYVSDARGRRGDDGISLTYRARDDQDRH